MATFIKWAAKQERVTLYQDADGVWFLEWFDLKAKFNWSSDKDPVELIERIIRNNK